jgi:hypothetical protein
MALLSKHTKSNKAYLSNFLFINLIEWCKTPPASSFFSFFFLLLMKPYLFCALILLTKALIFAQVPNLMNYQAVARNATGVALANQIIKVRLSANENNGTAFYTETRSITTNPLGLFNVQIGSAGATTTSGSLSATNWLDATKTRYLKVELDANNSGLYTEMGSQQLVSVPYAIAAGTAQTALTAQTAQTALTAQKLAKPFIGFRAYLKQDKTLTGGNYNTYSIVFDSQKYDSSNVYNNTTGEFTVPESGMYYLHTRLSIKATAAGLAQIFFNSSQQTLEDNRNITFPIFPPTTAGFTTVAYPNTIEHGIVAPLVAGEKIKITIAAIVKPSDWEMSQYEAHFFEAYKIN